MPTFYKVLTPLTIANAASNSNTLLARKDFSDCIGIVLYAPAALDGLTYTIQVTNDEGVTYQTLVDGDPVADQAPPLAGKARVYYNLPSFGGFRIFASGGATGAKVWTVGGVWSTD
jgi:hypothetical protein